MRTPFPARDPSPRQIVDFPFQEPISTITPLPVQSRASSKRASPSSSESQPGTSLISSFAGAKPLTPRTLGDEQAGHVHDADPREEAAQYVRRTQSAGRAPRHVAADLDDDLERRPCRRSEEDDAEQVARDEASEPGAEDRGRAGDERQHGEPLPRHAAALGQRRRDPEPFSDVVDHEADDEERPERQLPEREGRADRETLAEVVETDPDRDQRGKREAAHPCAAAALAHPGRDRGQEEKAECHTEQHQTGAAQRARQRRLELERLRQRLDGEEGEQAGGQRHEGGKPLRRRSPQRGQPEQSERDRHDPDERPDQGVAEEAPRRRLWCLHRGGDLLGGLDSGRAGDSDGDRLLRDPVVLDDDLARPEPPEGAVALDVERHDRVVDGDGCDRQVIRLRVRDADADLAWVEFHTPDVELVERRGSLAEQARHGASGGREERDDRRQEHERHERPQPPAPTQHGSFGSATDGYSSLTSKKPIQPSSANSDWCAWNMNTPGFAKSISMTPRCPCTCMTVSVYSQ